MTWGVWNEGVQPAPAPQHGATGKAPDFDKLCGDVIAALPSASRLASFADAALPQNLQQHIKDRFNALTARLAQRPEHAPASFRRIDRARIALREAAFNGAELEAILALLQTMEQAHK